MGNSGDTAAPRAAGETRSIDVREMLIAAVAGLGGTIAMAPLIAVAILVDSMEPRAFSGLAELLGFGSNFPFPVGLKFWVGLALFVVGGMTVLPLLFISLAQYLPPARSVSLRGVTYGTIVWSGFAIAFYTGQFGTTLWLYLGFTLLAHWVYGYVLSWLYVRYAKLPLFDV